MLHGEEVLFHGAIVSMFGDTPASNFVAGFKEGVGFALRKCRMCMATTDDINEKVCFLFASGTSVLTGKRLGEKVLKITLYHIEIKHVSL